MKKTTIGLAAMIGMCLSASQVQAITYVMKDLGTLGGGASTAQAVNESGHVVGTSLTAIGSPSYGSHAFLYDGITMQDLGTLGGQNSWANDINNLGQVAGRSLFDSSSYSHPFFYDGTIMTDLDTLIDVNGNPQPVTNGWAVGMNDLGHAVGNVATPGSFFHAFLYENNIMRDLGTLDGGSSSYALGINESGKVVGYSNTADPASQAFYYDGSAMINLGEVLGSTESVANDINDSGQITGSYKGGSRYRIAYLYDGNSVTDIGTLGGGITYAQSLNNLGDIVGYSYINNSSGTMHAFVYDGNTIKNLNSLVVPYVYPNTVLTWANDINDKGQIAAYGTVNGATHAFLLTPNSSESCTANCISCHGHDAGTKYDVDMNLPYQAGYSTSQGVGSFQSHSTHTEQDADDARGPGLYCSSCHDLENMPSLISGEDTDGDGFVRVEETTVCDSCHSSAGSYDGVNDSVIGAKANWKDGVYSVENVLQPGKESWCLGCHDESGANIAAITAPNIAGKSVSSPWQSALTYWGIEGENLNDNNIQTGNIEPVASELVFDLGQQMDVTHIRLYTVGNITSRWEVLGSADQEIWSKILYGRTVKFADVSWEIGQQDGWNEHRLDRFDAIRYIKLVKLEPTDALPSGSITEFQVKADLQYGYYVNGHKVSCDYCHDTTSKHIDGISRTYTSDQNNYNVGYRLANVTVGSEVVSAMEIPRVGNNDKENPRNSNDFALCFNCHDKAALLGDPEGTDEFFKNPPVTNFKNDEVDATKGYVVNEHLRHLQGRGRNGNSSDWDSDWDGTADSPQSCTACHNVHGSPNPAMTRHGELVSTPGTSDRVPMMNLQYLNADGIVDPDLQNAADSVGGQTQFFSGGPGSVEKNHACKMCHGDRGTYYREVQP